MKKSLSIFTMVFFVLTGTIKLNGQTVTKTSLKTSQTTTFNSAEKIPFNPEVKKGVLSNGLTYYIKNNGKPENKVELRLVVKAGSILEDEDQRGLAHFMEHMNFNGTKNFKKNELVDYLQSIGVKFGAHLNAYTSFDETVYMLPIPSDDPEKLEKGFQILEDWAHNALLTEKDIDEERGVVLEEFRLGQGADERMMQNYLPKLMYGSKYADRLPIGTKENLENFDYESLRRYYKDWYRPDLMAVIAVGDIDVETLENKIKFHFGGI
ncbi:MAG TPA: insulinase family protein, partial [Flavobacteriaceae bacterium]|nr:insulinase family protein [Flavobacteriaceae bacterium]